MIRCHKITITVFAKPEEDSEKIRRALIGLVPFDLEENKIEVKETNAWGFNERKIRIYGILLKRNAHINSFLKHLTKVIGGRQKELLVNQRETRLDDNLNFFIRLDKKGLIDGDHQITDSGSCYHIKMKIAAFPASRENALETVKEIFK